MPLPAGGKGILLLSRKQFDYLILIILPTFTSSANFTS